MKKILFILLLIGQFVIGQTVTISGQFNTDGNSPVAREDYTFKVLNYGSLYATVGSHNGDPNVTVSGSTVTIASISVDYSTTYSFSIVSVAGGYESSVGAAIAHTTPNAPAPSGDGLHPTLLNFRIENANPDRVLFDSSEELTGSTTTGFTVSGKTISSVTIQSGSTTGHYFTVSSAFTWWDNNTIRYEGGSNIEDTETNILYNFPLQYIQNNISEPTASTDRYVTVNGAGSHNGILGNEWTITEAFSNAQAGQTVHVQAGDYGAVNCVLANNGTATNPIKFIGYDVTPNDNPSLTRSVGMSFDSSKMPLLNNGSGIGINTNSKQYFILRNIQIYSYSDYGIQLDDSDFAVIDNVYIEGGGDFGIRTVDANSQNNRVINSYIANCNQVAVRLYNKNNLIENTWAVTSKVSNMDYYISVYGGNDGGNNIVRNNYLSRFQTDTHTGHGVSIKAGQPTYVSSYNLVENNTILKIRQALEARHHTITYGVYRNNEITGVVSDNSIAGGMRVLNGANNNLFIGNKVSYGKYGISFASSGEDPTAPDAGHNNKFINNILTNNLYGIFTDEDASGQNRTIYDNEILFCTFYNNDHLFGTVSNDLTANSNVFKNNIVTNSGNDDLNGNENGWRQSWSNYWNNTSLVVPGNTGVIEVNPNFVDTSDFVPQATMNGTPVAGVEYDGSIPPIEREKTNPTIGAKEQQ